MIGADVDVTSSSSGITVTPGALSSEAGTSLPRSRLSSAAPGDSEIGLLFVRGTAIRTEAGGVVGLLRFGGSFLTVGIEPLIVELGARRIIATFGFVWSSGLLSA